MRCRVLGTRPRAGRPPRRVPRPSRKCAGPSAYGPRRRAARRERGHRGARAAPRHARQPAAPAPAVGRSRERGGAVGRVGLQSPPAARRSALPAGAVARRLPARVRVRDRHRPLPAHHQPRPRAPRGARRGGAAVREGIERRGDPRRHRRRAFVADRRDGRERREHPAGDGARRHLRRPDRLQQRPASRATASRCCSRSRRAKGSSPATATSSARRSSPTARSIRRSAGPIPTPARPPTTTRRADR